MKYAPSDFQSKVTNTGNSSSNDTTLALQCLLSLLPERVS